MGSCLAAVDGVGPEKGPWFRRCLWVLFQLGCELRLAARNDSDVIGISPDRYRDRVVSRGVTGVERHQQMHAIRQRSIAQFCLDEAHPVEAELAGAFLGAAMQVLSRLDAVDGFARFRIAQKQLIQHESEIRVARAGVDQHAVRMACAHVEERRLEQPD